MFKYPIILGCDVAGVVETVVPGSTAASRFRVGDRVLGCTANNGFQDYVVLDSKLMTKILDHMVYRDAVVFGLCSATSAMLLFGKDYLHLDYPMIGAAKKGQSLLGWGGSSAVGSNAIQLATAAGYDVITTCSKKNFDYVKSLGSVNVFDYTDIEVIARVAAELDKGECAGIFMAAGLKDGNTAACEIASMCKQNLNLSSSSFIDNLHDVPKGVNVKQPTAENFKPSPDCWFETTPAAFGGYLPEALASRAYRVAPPPLVVNRNGLEGIQEAIDLVKKNNISAIKLVVERP
ncbi:Alcohol dehydrogenase superfamily, zinc-type [Penicillium occitanis (nom. inval.)]|nr:Alcohol dehydrogenase superfamily, zinc-type [Penicillium occitanis (nom. inval.)]PCG94984.1 hypothetical protein PENOC_080050 [Penicillium occitanis (nom. inval.)]